MDSYLEIARKVLHTARQPLSARQILKSAYQMQIVPRDLYGRTQHKTLQARLSTDILTQRSKSEFFRTGPGRFFLRSLLSDKGVPSRYKREYIAPLRAEQLGRYDVIAFSRDELANVKMGDGPKLDLANLLELPWRYERLEDVRRDESLLAFRFLIVVVQGGRVVRNEQRLFGERETNQKSAIGFEGIVRRDDHGLFSADSSGLFEAAARTVLAQFDLPVRLAPTIEAEEKWTTLYALFDRWGDAQKDDLTVALLFQSADIPEVAEAVESISTCEWLNIPTRVNDLSCFDRWSAFLLADAEFQHAVATA